MVAYNLMKNFNRLKRLRKTEFLRELVAETKIDINKLVQPLFVVEGKNEKQPINSMPGIFRYSLDNAIKEVEVLVNLGIKAILLFGIPNTKTELGSNAYLKNGVVQKAINEIKRKFPQLVVIADVCLCSYTTHGHCGIVKSNGEIDNDKTLKVLSKIALSYVEKGADIVAPSAMADGQVYKIRTTLDENGFENVVIMSYSAKYASNFYTPFREAADSSPKFSDRKTYQMDFRNADEALREIEQDIKEGADIVMVKPALTYLDVIKLTKQNFNIPVAAYNVSGEYSMVKAAALKGWLNEKNVVLETITAIKRAGADIIITYWAKDIAVWIKG